MIPHARVRDPKDDVSLCFGEFRSQFRKSSGKKSDGLIGICVLRFEVQSPPEEERLIGDPSALSDGCIENAGGF
jgi:hypothetical protein